MTTNSISSSWGVYNVASLPYKCAKLTVETGIYTLAALIEAIQRFIAKVLGILEKKTVSPGKTPISSKVDFPPFFSKKLITATLLIGGASLAAYFIYSYHFPPSLPKRIVNCITDIGEPKGPDQALDIFNCHAIVDPTFSLNTESVCENLASPYRSMARFIHPDKCKISRDKAAFQNAMIILTNAKEIIQKQLCSKESKIARCILTALFPENVLRCGGATPITCENLTKYAQNLAAIVTNVFPGRKDLLWKIAVATENSYCLPIPSFIANGFTT